MMLPAAREPVPMIHGEGQVWYGCHQKWFKSRRHRFNGCGPATAANMLAFAAAGNPGWEALYQGATEPFGLEAFKAHMERVRRHVVPGIFGMPSSRTFARMLARYGEAAGCSLEPEVVSGLRTAEEAAGYLGRALASGSSVAMLLLRHKDPALDNFQWHWMNVVNLDEAGGRIAIATYGKRYELELARLFEGTNPARHIHFVSL